MSTWFRSHQLKEKIVLLPVLSFSLPLFQVFYLLSLWRLNTKNLSIKSYSPSPKQIFYHLHYYLKTIAYPLLNSKNPIRWSGKERHCLSESSVHSSSFSDFNSFFSSYIFTKSFKGFVVVVVDDMTKQLSPAWLESNMSKVHTSHAVKQPSGLNYHPDARETPQNPDYHILMSGKSAHKRGKPASVSGIHNHPFVGSGPGAKICAVFCWHGPTFESNPWYFIKNSIWSICLQKQSECIRIPNNEHFAACCEAMHFII